MAKSLLSVKGKAKPARKTHSETYLVNRKYYGEEPTSNGIILRTDLMRAFTWYNNMAEDDELRGFVVDYLKHINNTNLTKKLKQSAIDKIPKTSIWVMRMHTRGIKLEGDIVERAHNNLVKAIDASVNDVIINDKPKAEKPNIQDRIRERSYDIIGDVEQLLDNGMVVNFYEWLQKNEIPAMYATKIADYYKPIQDELADAASGNFEGYESYTKTQLKGKAGVIANIIKDCERYSGNVKKTRAPRKKKAVTKDKLLKHFTYMKESNEHKIVSVNPENIIGSQTLWTFNTRNNILSVFNASGRDGLSINRTAITGYDKAQSKSFKIGRKTEERLQTVLKGGKIVIKRLIEEMNLEVSDRINNFTIILKAVR